MHKQELKTKEELSIMRACGAILGKVHSEILPNIVQPGITTLELDSIVEQYIREQRATPSFKGYQGFPNTLCISVNHQVVHGIPGPYKLQDGDIVSIDCGVFFQGFHTDAAFTYRVGNVDKELLNLLAVTEQALYKGIAQAIVGNRIGDISHAIQHHIENNNYSIVIEYCGHGVGRKLHENPPIPNYGPPNKGPIIQEGQVLAIEPIANQGSPNVGLGSDGWTVSTKDKKMSAHFEQTIAIVDGKPEILTPFQPAKKK